MRILRRLAVVLLSVAAGLVVVPAAGQAGPPPPEANFIGNNSPTIGLGVIHVRDGNYTNGTYDTVLRPGQRTSDFWATVAGYYIGTGYCAMVWIEDFDPGTIDYPTYVGAGQHFIPLSRSVWVKAYRC